jgi:hypothetical protein
MNLSAEQDELQLLIQYSALNKTKSFCDRFEFERCFKPGKQGVVGLVHTKDDKKMKCVFKMSQYVNHLAYHEYVVASSLSTMHKYCPHFMRPIDYVENVEVDPKSKHGNPFEPGKYPVRKDVIVLEYVAEASKMFNYIRSKSISDDILVSLIKQVLLAITIAQKKRRFTHYDLHSFNVLIKTCERDTVFLYVLSDTEYYYVPTYGFYPVIIDYGFAYIGSMDNGPMWPTLAHTDVGFLSDRFDWVADVKLFLISVSSEIEEERDTEVSDKLRRIVNNLFGELHVDWESGWDTTDRDGASDTVRNKLKKIVPEFEQPSIFGDFGHYCIDLVQSLIILPLQPQPTDGLEISYKSFLKEWAKIEFEVVNPFYSLCVLKDVVDAARAIHAEYLCGDRETQRRAVATFRQDVHDGIAKVAKFCLPKKVNYEILLCSLLNMAKSVEGSLFKVMELIAARKERSYSRLPVRSSLDVYKVIDANFPLPYKFRTSTTIVVLDTVKENRFEFPLSAATKMDLDTINQTHENHIDKMLYYLYKQSESVA